MSGDCRSAAALAGSSSREWRCDSAGVGAVGGAVAISDWMIVA